MEEANYLTFDLLTLDLLTFDFLTFDRLTIYLLTLDFFLTRLINLLLRAVNMRYLCTLITTWEVIIGDLKRTRTEVRLLTRTTDGAPS